MPPVVRRRRTPVQGRGRDRFDRIVSAATSLIGDVGIEQTTLTEVASRAGCAIGSLYQYFADKDALVDAVSDRLAARFLSKQRDVIEAGGEATLETFVPTLVRPIVAFWEECPAVLPLLDRIRRRTPSPQLAIGDRLHRLLAVHAPRLDAARRDVVVGVTIELIKSALLTLTRTNARRRPAILAEFETAITLYLVSKK